MVSQGRHDRYPAGACRRILSAPTYANIPSRTLHDDVFSAFVTFCRGTGFQVTHRRVDSGNDPENGFWAFPGFHASFIERSRKWVHRVSSSIYGHKTIHLPRDESLGRLAWHRAACVMYICIPGFSHRGPSRIIHQNNKISSHSCLRDSPDLSPGSVGNMRRDQLSGILLRTRA